MSDLDRLTAAFNSMNPWARGMVLEFAQGCADDFPAPNPAPHLPLATVGQTDAPQENRLVVSSIEGVGE